MKEIIVNGINLRLANPELGLREGMYYVSRNGDIYSMFVKRFLTPTLNKDNYMTIQFRTNDKKTLKLQVAKVVLATYLGMPPQEMKDPTVEHCDGNRYNNNISNLKWLERCVNSSSRINKGRGENNPKSKLTESKVHEICKLIQDKQISLAQIGQMYNVCAGAIWDIKRHKNWTYISDQYNF